MAGKTPFGEITPNYTGTRDGPAKAFASGKDPGLQLDARALDWYVDCRPDPLVGGEDGYLYYFERSFPEAARAGVGVPR